VPSPSASSRGCPRTTRQRSAGGFFPHLIAKPFHSGLREAFEFAIAACLVAALASWSRGGRVVRPEERALEQAVG
jgi:hypothetical protein